MTFLQFFYNFTFVVGCHFSCFELIKMSLKEGGGRGPGGLVSLFVTKYKWHMALGVFQGAASLTTGITMMKM